MAGQPRTGDVKHGHRTAGDESGKPDQRNPTQAVSLIVQIHQPENERAIATDPQDHGKWQEKPDWWVAIFTALLVLVTAGLWIFTGMMWWSTRNAVREGRLALIAARRANRLNAKALAHTTKMSEHELRAYVFVHVTRIKTKVINNADEMWVRLEYANSGKTPASEVRVACQALIVPEGAALDLTGLPDARPVGPLGPGDERKMDVDIITTKDAVAAAQTGQPCEIRLFGKITYTDEFSGDENRWTTFHCHLGRGAKGNTLHTHPHGNDYR